jgi:hypothetical protein
MPANDVLQPAIEPPVDSEKPDKNEAAAALGRLGGHARAERLTAERRKQIAREAALARWRKRAMASSGAKEVR